MHVVLVGGTGGFGRNHLLAWRKHPRVERLTILARDRARLDAVATEHGVSATDDPAALGSADLVDICTPTDTHEPLALRALAAGAPTIVEKPPCRTADQADALGTAAGTTPLFCVMNQLFAPHWLRARELLAEGAVGRVRMSLWPILRDHTALMLGTDFRADAARAGGVLLDGGFHLAYLVPWLLGAPVATVTAWAGQLAVRPPAGEDTGLAVWEVGASVAQITYSWVVPNAPYLSTATIIGDEATLVVPRSARQPFELLRGGESLDPGLGSYRSTPRNELANCLGHYLEAARTQTDPAATWEQAVTAQRVIEATEQAAAEGRRISL